MRHNGDKYVNTGINLKGPRGAVGPRGLPGKDGITPHIGENGNWFIGEQDTGNKAELNTDEYVTKEELEETMGESIIGDIKLNVANIDSRLQQVEGLAELSVEGGQIGIASATDFTNRTAEGDLKIPTVGAILNGADEEPTAGSDNLVKSGGVLSAIPKIVDNVIDGGVNKTLSAEQGNILDGTLRIRKEIVFSDTLVIKGYLNPNTDIWREDSNVQSYIIPVLFEVAIRVKGGVSNNTSIAFLTDYPNHGKYMQYCDGTQRMPILANEWYYINIPQDCRFISITKKVGKYDNTPSAMYLYRNDCFSEFSPALIFENGQIASATGLNVDTDAGKYIRSDFISDKIAVVCENDYSIRVFKYNSDGTYIGRYNTDGKYDKSGTVRNIKCFATDGSYKYRLVLFKSDLSVINPTDINDNKVWGEEYPRSILFEKDVLDRIEKIEGNLPDILNEYPIDVINMEERTNYFIGSTGGWATGSTGCFVKVPVNIINPVFVILGNTNYFSKYAFLKSIGGSSPDYCDGENNRHDVNKDNSWEITDIPSDCKYVWIAIGLQQQPQTEAYVPQRCSIIEKKSLLDYIFINSINTTATDILKLEACQYNKYISLGDTIPIKNSRVSYADFISNYWDGFIDSIPNITVTKEFIIKDTSGTYDIFKYVFTPLYYDYTIFLTAGIHGNEYEGFWSLYRLISYLYFDGYKNNELREIVRRCRIICIPVVNPYGMQNGIRYNSANVDPNYNYGPDGSWGDWSSYTHTGSYPFQYNEPKAVKMVCDEYGETNILFHIDFHTDPFSPTKGNYIEADEDSTIFSTVYRLSLDEEQNIKDRFNYSVNHSDQQFIGGVWTNNAATVFRYMELLRHIPSIIVEIAINGYAQSGSANIMSAGVNWYLNSICSMFRKLK